MKECDDIYKEYDKPLVSRVRDLNQDVICAKNPIGRALCFGDEGNPLVKNGTLIGIASWGCECQTKNPGVYTKIYSHLYWIEQELKN